MIEPTSNEPTDFDPPVETLVLAREDDADPVVGRATGARSPLIAATGFGVAALALFLVLNGHRVDRSEAATLPSAVPAQQSSGAPPPLDLAPTLVSSPSPGPFSGLPTTVSSVPPSPAPTSAPPVVSTGVPAPPASTPQTLSRLHAPAVVVDLGGAQRDMVLAQNTTAGGAGLGGGVAVPAGASASRPQLSDSEQFAKRIGDEEPERARATPMRNPHAVAPQGTIIPGVLETAINSDLPGFTRAVVSRDVLSFDGKAVLIPRGSRLIGQYKSAVALGQSRAFIIWTRVIRPDGVSILIGSPGTDELGRGGLDGQVDRHFFRRFSGSILLSVLNAAVASVGRTPSTQISIGSPGAATGLAGSITQGDAIAPTIKVAQGAAINIFVARDLDFSDVESGR